MRERLRHPKAGAADLGARREAAEELAIAALGFIAGDDERLGAFLALTGIAPESLRTAAREPNFLLGVLDHLASDEALLIAFAQARDTDPAGIIAARDALARAMPQVP